MMPVVGTGQSAHNTLLLLSDEHPVAGQQVLLALHEYAEDCPSDVLAVAQHMVGAIDLEGLSAFTGSTEKVGQEIKPLNSGLLLSMR